MKQTQQVHKLSDLKPGQSAVITGFNEEEVPLKMLEMGLLPGNKVLVKRISPLGDPIHIRVVGFDLALRKEEAALVKVDEVLKEKTGV